MKNNPERTDKTLDELLSMDEETFSRIVATAFGVDEAKVYVTSDAHIGVGKRVKFEGEHTHLGPGASVSQIARELACDAQPRTLGADDFYIDPSGDGEYPLLQK